MLTQRYQIVLLLGIVFLVSGYLLLPLTASYLLAKGLRDYGYKKVIIQLGYPGWHSMRIPVVSFQQDLGGERLMISVTDAEIQYDVVELRHGHVDRIILRDVMIQVLNVAFSGLGEEEGRVPPETHDEESPWSLLTAGDLLRSLPILPFDELQLDHLTVFREQATGPLRKVTVAGSLLHRDGELGGRLLFQGRDTASYSLTLTGNSASTWSATLESQRPQTTPIVSWRSEARTEGSQVHVGGRLDVNVQGLAPFIALLVPIGPELGRVTGQVTIGWTGNAAAAATLTSLWQDPHTHLDGTIRVTATLPALRGVAKDIALAYEGTFAGNAMQVKWTLTPGVLLSATMNTQPRIIPELVRAILPHGDQPVRIENRKPVQGTLYWTETPIRMVAEGPLYVTYGKTSGPLVAQFETTRAESVGNELVLAEGAYKLEGALPKSLTDLLAAKEAMGGVHGTVQLDRTHVRGVLLPASAMTIKHIERGDTRLSSVSLELTDALTVECNVDKSRCVAGPAVASIVVPTVKVMGRTAKIDHARLFIQQAETVGPAWSARGILSINGVTVDPVVWGITASDWAINFVATHSEIKADVQANVPLNERVITVSIEQSLKAAQGSLHGTIGPVSFNGMDRRLSKMVGNVPRTVDIVEGTVDATIDASWSGGIGTPVHLFKIRSGTAKIVADKLSGQYHDYIIRGLSTTMTLRAQGAESLIMTQPAPITVSSVYNGINATNIASSFQMVWNIADDLPTIDVRDFRCDLFGGSVVSRGPVVDLAKPPVRLTAVLRNLDLAKILSVEQQKGLQGTGIVNGMLPITMTAGGLFVKDGVIEAQPPGGVIRYASAPESSKVISEADSDLHLVSEALNNFHYSLLRIGVKYGENGTLDLNARLEGRNPDLANIPPIHFNLTVQEHIPTLLKSLRVVDDIQGTIEKRYRRL